MTIKTQAELDKYINELREWGYPYLGSDESVYALLPDGRIFWYVPGEEEEWSHITTQDDFAESVKAWQYDY